VKGRNDQALEGREVGARAAAGRQRHVDVKALAAPLAAAAAVTREQAVLVQGDHQCVRVLVEGLLRAVAMMHVPVDNGDAADFVGRPRLHDGDWHVREQAEPQALVALRMLSGRPDERVAVFDPPPRGGVDNGRGSARGEQRDVVAAGTEGGEVARVAAAIGAESFDALDIGAGVKQAEVFVRERQRGDGREVVEQPRNFDEVAEAALGGGVLGVLARFDRQPRREERRDVAGVVPEIEFVKIPAGRHALVPRGFQESARIIRAARSAIIIVGVCRLPEIMRGMTEASAIRSPSSPCTFMLDGSTTAFASTPIRQVLEGW
jgi:hypothetical protein